MSSGHMTPYENFETQGYSLTHLAVIIFSGVFGLITGVILLIVIIRIMNAIEPETLELIGTVLLFGLVALFLFAAGLWIIAIYTKIKEPGVQLSGRAGEIEKRIGLG